MLRVVSLFLVFLLSSSIFAEGSIKPEAYVRTKGGIALTLEKSKDGPHRANGIGARLHPNDSNLLVSAHKNGVVALWNIKERATVWTKSPFEGGVFSIEMSFDGKFVFVAGNNGDVRVLQTSDGEQVAVESFSKEPKGFPLSGARNAPVVAYGRGEKNRELAWRFYSSEKDFEFTDRGSATPQDSKYSYVNAVSWDGKMVAMLSNVFDGKIKYSLSVYDSESSELLFSYPRNEPMIALAFSPDGKYLAFWGGPGDPRVILFDVEKKKETMMLHPDVKYITQLKFSPDGKFLYCVSADLRPIEAGKPGTYVSVSDVATGKFLRVLSPSGLESDPSGRVSTRDLSVSADGKRLALAFTDGAYPEETIAGLPDLFVIDIPN